MDRPYIRYGNDIRPFDPPEGWTILTFADVGDQAVQIDVARRVGAALANPIGSLPLKERISPSDTVAVLIEDKTRMSPKKEILSALLEELAHTGLPRENIVVVVALGTHAPLTEGELEKVYGKDVSERYALINHDCYAADLAPVGRLRTGTPVKINRRVREATFRIGIGSIFPHPMNGFGGGAKILFPGVADFDSILEHHLHYSFQEGCGLGELAGNPFYESLCEVTREAGLDFIVNSILDQNDRLFDLVAGDPIEAHREGIAVSRGIVSRNFPKRADLTLISAFPYREGPQIMKPLAPASFITRQGGVIILVAHCTSAIPDIYLEGCERFRRKFGNDHREGILTLFRSNRRIIEDGPPELNMSAAQALLAQQNFRVILVSEEISPDTAARLGFLFAENLEDAFALSAKLVPTPDVHVLPVGGVMLPVLDGS